MKMRDNILKRVRMMEKKNGTQYAKKNGVAYSRFRILYLLAGIYTLVMHLLLVLGLWMLGKMGAFKTEITVMGICTALIIVGYVMTFFTKKYVWWDIIAGVISVVSEIVLVILFSRMLEAEVILSKVFRYKASYYYRHLGPLVIMVICITAMTVIVVRERIILKKAYKKVLENLYDAYREKLGDSFSEQAWQEFVNTYDPEKHHELFSNKKQKSVSEKTRENKRNNEDNRD